MFDATFQKLFNFPIAQFKLKLICMWSSDEYTSFTEEAEDSDEDEDEDDNNEEGEGSEEEEEEEADDDVEIGSDDEE